LTPEKWFKFDAKIKEEQILKRGYSDVYEKEYIKKDGTIFPVEIRSFLLNDEKGKPQSIWSIIRDISERKKTEKELRKVERLESLGVLAGGIAHDFNNLLTGILGNISLAQIKEGEGVGDLLEDAKQASIQAKNLTQHLLTFAKGGEPVKGAVSIENVIKIASGFTLHGSNVKCVYEFSSDLWKVEVDKGQMSQVIDNLVINAKQAMPSGGKIKIKTENIILKKDISIPLPGGKYVKITFSDEGMGIPKSYLSRIFDPYFTTKQKGSGLGLATVFSVIQKHDGYVTVESEPGKGTTFYIYLPVKEIKKMKGEAKRKEKQYLHEEGRILVMDDEVTIRNTLGGILKKLGYVVTLTTKGEEALEEYKRAKLSNKPYDIVILDLTIAGGMGGKKTMEELLKIDPDVKAVVSSGYSTDPIMAHFDEYGFKAVAVKPYDVDGLIEAIRKAFE
jgi:signal transduction histidine kinase/ActR/RegA family two-component response regulator